MDFREFRSVSFLPSSGIGRLCVDLNNILGQGVWYDTIQVQNTKCLLLANDIVTTMNSDKVLCGSLGSYPSYMTRILNSVKEIRFYVQLNYADFTEECIADKESCFFISHIRRLFPVFI